MNPEIAIVLAVLVIAFVFFIFEWLAPDVVALGVASSLALSGVVGPDEVFEGFSSGAVITIAGLMIIGHGLARTGVVRWVARRLEGVIRGSKGRLLILNTTIPGVLSGFINIVASASFFIPVILRLSRRLEVAPSKILLPMASCALIGANLTLIGASHNLVVDSILRQETGAGFGFFEFTALGLVFLVVAILYILLAGRHLLPSNADPQASATEDPDLMSVYELSARLHEVWVAGDLPEEGLSTSDLDLEGRGLTLLALARGDEHVMIPREQLELCEDDVILLQGQGQLIERLVRDHPCLSTLGAPRPREPYPLSNAELAEAVVPPRSPMVGKRIDELDLSDAHGVTPIAHYRNGSPQRTAIRDIELAEGDSLLVYGPRSRVRSFEPERELLVYFKPGEPEVSSAARRRAPWAALVLLLTVIPAAVGWFPIAVTATCGALIAVLLKVVPASKLYHAIDGRTLVLIAGIYPLGLAINETGAGKAIGDVLIQVLGSFGPLAVMGGIAVVCMILTQPIHNAAVAIIMTPIAIDAARLMDSSPRAFCVAVLVACSTTFLMPHGHPAPYLVRSPGAYESVDYLKFGSGLSALALSVILIGVPMVWPL